MFILIFNIAANVFMSYEGTAHNELHSQFVQFKRRANRGIVGSWTNVTWTSAELWGSVQQFGAQFFLKQRRFITNI